MKNENINLAGGDHPTLTEDEIETSIAIIASTGRFPGAQNVAEFTDHIRSGKTAVREFSRRELLAAGVPACEVDHPDYRPYMGWLDKVDQFDADLFGIIPKHAQIMDPQQRIFMECAWEVCERAGYAPRHMPGRVGVFAGCRTNSYLVRNIVRHETLVGELGWNQILLLNDADHLPLRVAHALNLSGPALSIGATCSTSLAAIHLACQSLLNFEADMMLAGGASVMVPDKEGYQWVQGSINAANGECRAFDKDASGTVSGNGVGVVLLKRLADALEDGDQILSVVRGGAVGNDGADKSAYAAPAIAGQSMVLQTALADADVDPETIEFVETHGTGTHVGDPIEFEALQRAYGRTGPACHLGALKPITGHLSAAAGVAAVIKATACLQDKYIPPMVNFVEPSPELGASGSRFKMSSQGQDWLSNNTHPRRAGVSAFGLGGANAHVVLQEAPLLQPHSAKHAIPADYQFVLPVSARSVDSLVQACAILANWLETVQPETLADLAYTLQNGREHFGVRAAVVAATWQDAAQALTHLAQQDEAQVSVPALQLDRLDVVRNSALDNWLQGEIIDWDMMHVGPCSRILLPTTTFQHQSYWVSSPEGEVAPFLMAPDKIATQSQDYLAPHLTDAAVSQIDMLVDGIDAATTAYVLNALATLGFSVAEGEHISLASALERCRVKPAYSHLFRRLMQMLVEDGFAVVHTAADTWVLSAQARNLPDPEQLLDNVVAGVPSRDEETKVFRQCGSALAALLTGEESARDILFPDGGLEQVSKDYRDTERAQIVSGLVGHAVEQAIANLPMGRGLSVLEIGGGTGGTSHYVLPKLPADRTKYLFTDVSPHFLVNGRENLQDYDFIDYEVYDICKPATEQGIAAQSFDLIIAANVLHLAPNLTTALAQIETLLAPGGMLVMLQGTANTRFSDIIFGTFDTWDGFEDHDVRTNGAFTTSAVWQSLMHTAGFAETQSLPAAADERGMFASVSVLLAQAPLVKAPLDAGVVSAQFINQDKQVAAAASAPQDGAVDVLSAMGNIWKNVFGSPLLEPHHRFFEIGGDSLIATQVLSRVRAQFGVELPVKYFFSNPAIVDAAAAVTTLLNGGSLDDAGAQPAPEAAPAHDTLDNADLLESVSDISDEDLESLLAELEV